MNIENKLILIDSNNIAYRAFYALPQTIATSTGVQTNAVYGFTSMLLKLIEDYKPQTIICVFDCKGPTFRHDVFEQYKAQRKKMPDELSNQIRIIKEVIESLNISSIEVEGFEADDVISAIIKQVSNDFTEIIVVSSDKDILQILSPNSNVSIIALKKGITETVLYNYEKVLEKYEVKPENIRDLLALTGDTSDNIPGAPGIGPKTAQDLIKKFGSIENIFKNIDEIKNEKLRNLLLENETLIRKSLELVTLKDDLKLDIKALLLKNFSGFELKKAEDLFDSLEFKTLKNRLYNITGFYNSSFKAKPNNINNNSNKVIRYNFNYNIDLDNKILLSFKNCVFINTIKFIENKQNKQDKKDKQDTLSKNEDYKTEEYLVIFDGLKNFLIFSRSFLIENWQNLNLKKLLENAELKKIGFDFKQIYKFFKENKFDLSSPIEDFKIQYLLLNPVKPDIDFKGICSELIDGYNEKIVEDIKISQQNYQSPLEFQNNPDVFFEIIKKLINEVSCFPQVHNKLSEKIKIEKLDYLYYEIEAPLIEVLAEMEFKGVSVDVEYLEYLIKEYEKNIKDLTNQIYKLCNKTFNINSTQQLAKTLYQDLKLIPTKKTKTGYSTDASTLISLINLHPVIEKILDYREKVKLKNTYLDVLPKIVDEKDKRVHATYNQLGTTTGRISSNNPNLQNIPIRTELGRQIRKAFIPGIGYDLLISADYSQIELRVLAHLANDEELIKAFNLGEDIHAKTASEIFGVSYDKVDENLRRKAKAINFGIIYGMTEFGLKSRLDISEDEARQYIQLYFNKYPKIKEYINSLITSAYKTGYAVTMFGRKRYIKELASTNANIRNLGERLAINTPIQGTAADIMKIATVKIFKSIKEQKLDSNIILHVHDEIVLEVKKNDVETIKNLIKNAMENAVNLKTSLKVDIKVGKNWLLE